MISLPQFTPAFPEIFLALAGMVMLIIGVFRAKDSTTLLTWLGIAAMAATVALILRYGGTAITFNGMFVVNGFTVFSKILVLIGAALTLLMITSWAHIEKTARFELPVIVVF